MRYRQVCSIGGKGNAPGQFAAALRGIAVGRRDEVYAAGDSEIKVFDTAGTLRCRWPTARPALSLGIAPDGSIFAGELRQVEVFEPGGKRIRTWHDESLLVRVTGLGFLGQTVLVGDSAGRVIRRFDLAGRLLNTIGHDNPVHGFMVPNGVVSFAVDRDGTIHACNPGKHRVEHFTPEGKLLGHLGRFDGNDPVGFTGCCNPTNVAVSDGIYVTEKAVPRAKVYEFSGALRAVINAQVFDANCKNMSIATGSGGRVYVADTVKLAIFVFEPDAAVPPSGSGGKP